MSAVIGKEVVFRIWGEFDSSVAHWKNIAEVIELTPPEETADSVETTTMDTDSYFRTFISGLIDAGECSLTIQFDRTNYELFRDDLTGRTEQNYEIVLPDAENTSMEFAGCVISSTFGTPIDDRMTMSFTIKLSGQPTIDSGSGS